MSAKFDRECQAQARDNELNDMLAEEHDSCLYCGESLTYVCKHGKCKGCGECQDCETADRHAEQFLDRETS